MSLEILEAMKSNNSNTPAVIDPKLASEYEK